MLRKSHFFLITKTGVVECLRKRVMDVRVAEETEQCGGNTNSATHSAARVAATGTSLSRSRRGRRADGREARIGHLSAAPGSTPRKRSSAGGRPATGPASQARAAASGRRNPHI